MRFEKEMPMPRNYAILSLFSISVFSLRYRNTLKQGPELMLIVYVSFRFKAALGGLACVGLNFKFSHFSASARIQVQAQEIPRSSELSLVFNFLF